MPETGRDKHVKNYELAIRIYVFFRQGKKLIYTQFKMLKLLNESNRGIKTVT